MATLKSKTISAGVEDILTVDAGLTSSLKTVELGDGTDTKLQLSTTQVRVVGSSDVTTTQGTGSLVIGSGTDNIGIDGNEIMARNVSGETTLILNNDGGGMRVGGSTKTLNGEANVTSINGGLYATGRLYHGNGGVNGKYKYYVKLAADGGDDANDGRSWDTAVESISHAISRSPSGGTVIIYLDSGDSGAVKTHVWNGSGSQDYNQNKHIIIAGATDSKMQWTELSVGGSGQIFLYNTTIRINKLKIKAYGNPSTTYGHGRCPFRSYYGTRNNFNIGTWTSETNSCEVVFADDIGTYVDGNSNTVNTGYNCLISAEQSNLYVSCKKVKVTAWSPSSTLNRPNNIVQCTGDGDALVTFSGGSHSTNLCLINDKGAAQFHLASGGGIYKSAFSTDANGDGTDGAYFVASSSWAQRTGISTTSTQF